MKFTTPSFFSRMRSSMHAKGRTSSSSSSRLPTSTSSSGPATESLPPPYTLLPPPTGDLGLCYELLTRDLNCDPAPSCGFPDLSQFMVDMVERTGTTPLILSHTLLNLRMFLYQLGEPLPDLCGHRIFFSALIRAYRSRPAVFETGFWVGSIELWATASGMSKQQIRVDLDIFVAVLSCGTNIPNVFNKFDALLEVKEAKGYQYNSAWKSTIMQVQSRVL